ncbi:MAG: hypothetical protein IKD69_15675 [Solobacterium sp.]|nr:hypothetical protein [Solobacterium sp.]
MKKTVQIISMFLASCCLWGCQAASSAKPVETDEPSAYQPLLQESVTWIEDETIRTGEGAVLYFSEKNNRPSMHVYTLDEDMPNIYYVSEDTQECFERGDIVSITYTTVTSSRGQTIGVVQKIDPAPHYQKASRLSSYIIKNPVQIELTYPEYEDVMSVVISEEDSIQAIMETIEEIDVYSDYRTFSIPSSGVIQIKLTDAAMHTQTVTYSVEEGYVLAFSDREDIVAEKPAEDWILLDTLLPYLNLE